jgi:glyoxalase family protein
VLFRAHALRVARGDKAIGETHLADAIEALVAGASASLSADRTAKNPYRADQ